MQKNQISKAIPFSKILMVLISFPIISTLLSLLQLNRNLITDFGFDFSDTFRVIVTCWYIIQIFLISKILNTEGWSWKDIGYSLNTKNTVYFILGFLIFAFGLFFFIEYALANSEMDSEKLKSIVNLSPKDKTGRIIFIFLALVAGLSEEIVYRGFAIKSLISNNVNKWLAIVLAAIPFFFQHGIKAYQLTWGTWYIVWGIVFGLLFLWLKKLTVNIIIHWLVILSAMAAILQDIK